MCFFVYASLQAYSQGQVDGGGKRMSPVTKNQYWPQSLRRKSGMETKCATTAWHQFGLRGWGRRANLYIFQCKTVKQNFLGRRHYLYQVFGAPALCLKVKHSNYGSSTLNCIPGAECLGQPEMLNSLNAFCHHVMPPDSWQIGQKRIRPVSIHLPHIVPPMKWAGGR